MLTTLCQDRSNLFLALRRFVARFNNAGFRPVESVSLGKNLADQACSSRFLAAYDVTPCAGTYNSSPSAAVPASVFVP